MNVRFWLIFGAMSLAPSLLLADDFSSLEESMTLDQFKKAGLEQLSPVQLQFLNHWLQHHGELPQSRSQPTVASAAARPVEASPAPKPNDDSIGFAPKDSDRSEIRSNIVGEFYGWGAKTRFTLANGQVWQQVGTGDFTHHAVNPGVVIKPKALGSWKLYIDGVNRGVKVKRIK